MSGGHFNYDQYRIKEIADEIYRIIKSQEDPDLEDWQKYLPEVIEEFKKALTVIRVAYVYAQRIDWLVCGDDGEDSFFRRLKEELAPFVKEENNDG